MQSKVVSQKKESAPPRIAVVVQRFGEEVNGGAEVHARMLVDRLVSYYQIDVLTTCAKDYVTWKAFYETGLSTQGQINIRRFANAERNMEKQTEALKALKYHWPIFWRRKLFKMSSKWVPYTTDTLAHDPHGQQWLEAQGPYSPELVQFIQDNKSTYDAFIFSTSLYFTAAACLPFVGNKSILVPHLHNETTTFLPVYRKLFDAARYVVCNTPSELRLVDKIFNVKNRGHVAGVSIDIADAIPGVNVNSGTGTKSESSAESSPQGLPSGEYVLYLGRVSASKGCKHLFRDWSKYKADTGSPVQLVVAGGTDMEVPATDDVVYLGYVSEAQKQNLLANALCLVVPSRYESLSLVLLESFAYKVPVLVNKQCEVLKDHIDASKGGYAYTTYHDFKEYLTSLLTQDDKRRAMGMAGFNYLQKEYSWTQFDQMYITLINAIIKEQKAIASEENSYESV